MSGIAGILKNDDKIALEELKAMTDILEHRGPNGESHWINTNLSVGIGWRHFSPISISGQSVQSLTFGEGRFTIVFDGEIYNYSILKEKLIQKGIQFFSDMDSELIVNLFKLKREKCLEDIDGAFSFALWDEVKQRLFCARDRFGEKPFFYHYVPGKLFVFASEIKAIHHYGISKSPNEPLIYNFFLFNHRTGNVNDKSETFFANIKKLPNSHYLIIDKNLQISLKKYWDINWRDQFLEYDEDEATETLRELINESIKKRLLTDMSIGASLSGGLDSSGIVCWIDKYLNTLSKPQKTFSARFKNHKKDEGNFMEKVIGNTSVDPYFTWPDASTLLNDLDKLFFHQDEPFGSASIFAQWQVMKLAKEKNVRILLDGQGADEVFAGYHPYYRLYINRLYQKNRKQYFHELKIFNEVHDPGYRGYLKHNWRYHLSGIKVALVNNFKRKTRLFHEHLESLHRNKDYEMESPVNLNHNLYLSLLKGNNLEDLLRYADRSSMAFSLQTRLPFLDHKLVEFVFTLPDDLKLKNGWTKYILRKALDGITPDEITWRRDKIGYEPPQKQWMESRLVYDYLEACYSLLVKKNILNKNLNREQKLRIGWQIIMVSKLYT